MADPQPEDAHLRIAHELLNELMASEFTKRQWKLLIFILRLSWGCAKKYAVVPRQKDFEVSGVGETHIKTELEWLIKAKVIHNDDTRYWFNKDYDQWRVSRSRTFSAERLGELISLNIKDAKTNGAVSAPKEKVTAPPQPKHAEAGHVVIGELQRENEQAAQEIWDSVLVELREQVSSSNYTAWLEKTVGISYHDSRFIVGTPNATVTDYLDKNQCSLIEKMLVSILEKPVKVFFYVLSAGGRQ